MFDRALNVPLGFKDFGNILFYWKTKFVIGSYLGLQIISKNCSYKIECIYSSVLCKIHDNRGGWRFFSLQKEQRYACSQLSQSTTSFWLKIV